MAERSAPSPKFLQRAGDFVPLVGKDGPVELGLFGAALGFFSGVKAIPASCSFLLAFASSPALSGLWELDAADRGA